MTRRKRRRINLGSTAEKHRDKATAFALQALRRFGEVHRAPTCQKALDLYTQGAKHLGALDAHIKSMERNVPLHLERALIKAKEEARNAQTMIASRCVR